MLAAASVHVEVQAASGSGRVNPPEGIRREQIQIDRLRVDQRIWRRQQVSLASREPK